MSTRAFKFEYIPLDKLYVSTLNVRTNRTLKKIDELAESIKKIGVQQPIVVVRRADKYEVIIGQRRYEASKLAGIPTIPAVIRTIQNDNEAIIASFSENIHRLDLSYKDKNRVAERLLAEYDSTAEVAEIIGVTEKTVRNYLGYSIVPEEIKRMVEQGEISAQTAISIARGIPDEEKAIQVAMQVRETPRSSDRRKLISLARDYPEATPTELENLLIKSKFSKITVDFTPMISDALMNASTTYQTEVTDIITEALSDWLSERGFLE